jgi:hypothetical protein
MNIVTSEFKKTVEDLINNLKIEDFSDSEEHKLTHEYNALPLGFDFLAYTFITSDGEVIWHDFKDDFGKSSNSQSLINALVYAKKRFPQLEKFIPNRSENSKTCPICEGTGIWKHSKNVVTGESGNCVICATLGWITNECYEQIISNQKS